MAFPTLAPIPHVNGNLQAKSFGLTIPPVDFIPVNGNGVTMDREAWEFFRGFSGYTTSVLCYAAMRYRATKLAEAPLMVVQQTDEGEDWLDDHELAELLQYPNEDEEMADIIEQLSLSMDATGMGLLVKDRDRRNRPARLTFFTGDEFEVKPTDDRIYGEFRVSATGLQRRDIDLPPTLPPERVIFFRLPDPNDRWHGLAPLRVVARRLGLEQQLLASQIAAIPNAVVPSMTVIANDGTTPAQLQEYADVMRLAYTNARNHGRPFWAADVKDVKQNKLGFDGLEGGELYREIESAVCVAFAVQPAVLGMMIGLESGSPLSNGTQMESAQRFSYDEGIIPGWRRMSRIFTRQLLRPIDDTQDRMIQFDTSMVRALQEDLNAAAERQEKLKGVATKNERRVIGGLDKKEGAEWEELEAPPLPAGAEPPVDDEPMGAKAKSVPQADALWHAFDLQAKAAERVWEPAVAKMLASQSTDIQRIFQRWVAAAGVSTPTEATLSQFLTEVGDYLKGMGAVKARAVLHPLVNSTVQAEGVRMTTRFGISYSVVQKGLARYAETETAFLVAKMGETTGRQVARAVQASIEEKEPMPALRNRLEQLPAFGRERAELVARTETTRTTNTAQRRTLSEYQDATDSLVEKAWISSRDDRVRDEHDALDNGEYIPIDQPFDNGLQQPGEPNCRCTLGYRIVRRGDNDA